VEIVERVLGPDHPDLSARLEDLASLGEIGFQALLERALAIAEGALGPDHPDVARRLLGVGRGLRWQVSDGLRVETDDEGARACFERALAIAERAQGPDGPLVGEALSELALVLVALGDLERAQACAERALAIAQRVSAPDHPSGYGKLRWAEDPRRARARD
jgi:tetratricopeptide (TPR) repeat protein